MILAIDVGTRNLAYVLCHENERKMIIKEAKLIDTGKKCVAKLFIFLVKNHLEQLCKIKIQNVVIEQQTKYNQRAFALAHALFGFFVSRQIDVSFVSPVSKFNNFLEMAIVKKDEIGRGNKKKRKILAVELTNLCVEKLKIINIDLNKFKKKDDVADAFIYAFNFLYDFLDTSKIDKRKILKISL